MQSLLPIPADAAEFTQLLTKDMDGERSIYHIVRDITTVSKKGIPLFGEVLLEYTPDKKAIVLDTWDAFVDDFYGVEMSWDEVVDELIEAVVQCVAPRYVRITIITKNPTDKFAKVWKAGRGYVVYPEDWDHKALKV